MRSTRYNPGVVFLCAVLLFGCTARRVYQSEANNEPPSPSAININTATVDELEKLPHIGSKTAEAIVRFRTENGPFRRPEDLMQIRGMSETRFGEISQNIRTE